ncbi:MAG: DUF4252 domain-containing protein [Bacteroidota bacterium]
MKRLIILPVLLFSLCSAFAQQSTPVDKIFDKYSGKEGITTVYISSMMFNLMNNLEVNDPEYQDFKKATQGIKSMRILSQDQVKPGEKGFARELLDILPKDQYQQLMVVKEEGQDVLFLAREEKGVVVEFLLLVSGKDENALIDIQGVIDLESIASLSKGMGMEELEKLDELEKK